MKTVYNNSKSLPRYSFSAPGEHDLFNSMVVPNITYRMSPS